MFIKKLALGIFCIGITLFESSLLSAQEEKNDSPIILSTVIHASAQDVWNVLVDFENYGHWNAWVSQVQGDAKLGSVVKAYGRSSSILSLKLKITKLEAPHSICWVDVTWFTVFGAGGWRCRHIEEIPGSNSVKFINHFEYTGVFKSTLAYFSRESLINGMILENVSLKNFVENKN